MKKTLFILILSFCISCKQTKEYLIFVDNNATLLEALKNVKAGNEIILKDGIYKDVEIQFFGEGTKEKPIILRAENPGKVFIEGQSSLEIGGTYLEVAALYFRNGYTPKKNIIRFKIDDDKIAFNSKVTNCVIDEFTQLDRDDSDHWVEFWGQNNELSNNYIAGKSNFGPTIMVRLEGNENINNHHQIINNHFGPRPRKGGPHGETLQIGDSGTSMTPSYTNVENNYFERCNGEVEIISSKSNFNIFKNNVFFESEGSLVLRHGNYAKIDGNVFIGNDNSKFIGGIRVINTGHWITNNYFYKLKGEEFRAPIAVMNGIPKSPLNRYNQVTDVVVAYNSWVECPTPWYFSVGSNVSQSAVLPKSEIRSARPERTLFANNLIYNTAKATFPINNYDKVDGVTFKNNSSNNDNKSEVTSKGISKENFTVIKVSENLFTPTKNMLPIYNGFDFKNIETDIFGTKRTAQINTIGAIVNPIPSNKILTDKSNYGTSWFSVDASNKQIKTLKIFPKDLQATIKNAQSGDIITIESGEYTYKTPIIIDKEITITSVDKSNKTILNFNSDNTAFLMLPKGNLHLENIIITGNGNQNTFSTLDKNMSKAYNLFINDSEISDFKAILEVSKGSFADTIMVVNATFKNFQKGFNVNKETNDGGDYNAEFIIIKNSTFDTVSGTILDYYRGGYDESTIGGNLLFENNTVTNSGKKSEDKILIKNRGILNVEMKNNTFQNNPVKLIAILWGEKGQEPVNNFITNSGEFQVVQNLKLKLMY